jgi:hypothetical protein
LPKIGPVVEPTINFLAEDEVSARSDEVTLQAGLPTKLGQRVRRRGVTAAFHVSSPQ